MEDAETKPAATLLQGIKISVIVEVHPAKYGVLMLLQYLLSSAMAKGINLRLIQLSNAKMGWENIAC